MAFKILFLAAFVAFAQAGGPAAYSISALSGDHAYVGSSQEHTVKGLYGQNVISSYSKAVDSAHSSVRVSSSRQSNDILGAGYHGGYGAGYHGGYGAGYGYAAPAYSAGYGVSKVVSPYAAPVAYGGYSHGYSKVVSPVSSVVSHGYAAPAIATHAVAAPAYGSYGHGYGVSPAVYGGYGHGLGYATKVATPVSTVVSHGYAAPALGYNKVVSPAVYGGYGGYGGYGAYGSYGGYHGVAAPSVYGHNLGYGVSKVVSPLSTVVNHGYGAHSIGYAPKVVAPVSSVVSHGYAAPVSSVVSHGYAAPALGYGVAKYPIGVAAPAVYGNSLGYGVSKVHSVAAPVAYGGYGGYGGYGAYGGYGGYGVSKVVSPVATYGVGAVAPVAAVKTVASPAFTASVVSPGVSYSW